MNINSKKLTISVTLICVLLVTFGAFCFVEQGYTHWDFLHERKEYSDITDISIEEITLKKTVDSAEWVVFKDADLIGKWSTYISQLQIKRKLDLRFLEGLEVGGNPTVIIKIGMKTIFLSMVDLNGTAVLEIDGKIYSFQSNMTIPFDETYSIAAERYGEQSV